MSGATSVDITTMKSLFTSLALVLFLAGLASCDYPESKVPGNCYMNDVTQDQWDTNLVLNISDTDRGEILRRGLINVLRVSRIEYLDCDLLDPPYLDTQIQVNDFVLSLNNRFANYEVNEISESMSVLITFECIRGIRSLLVKFNIRDTNNHPPAFVGSNNFTIPVRLPLSKGYPVSTVFEQILVRDIDLTNYAIAPTIQANDYFDLVYDKVDYSKKIYNIILVTKQEIKTLDAPLTLFITAVDVDTTGYPPLTAIGLVNIYANGSNIAPDVPQFEFPYYEGLHDTDEVLVNIAQNITLVKGYDISVVYNLTGAGVQYFDFTANEENITIFATGVPIPDNIIYSPEAVTLTLSARSRSTGLVGATVIIISFVQEPNCELRAYNESTWTEGLWVNIVDTFEGDSVKLDVANVVDILYYEDEPNVLNNGPYFMVERFGNRVDFQFGPKFINTYESFETALQFKTFITFKCARGERTLPVIHNITDTNNHGPEFRSNKAYSIFTPLPANFSISRAYGDIIIRDIDLTTYAINITFPENDYLRLVPNTVVQDDKKEFRFSLVTVRDVIGINGTVDLQLEAADLDLTSDPPRNIIETLTLSASGVKAAEEDDM